LPSAQLLPFARGVFTQPSRASQESAVHGLPSSQTVGDAPTQTPPWQVSTCVHTLLSLQGVASARLVLLQSPLVGSQASAVQGFPSLQFGPPVPAQTPPVH
jgi:hypothetical protein